LKGVGGLGGGTLILSQGLPIGRKKIKGSGGGNVELPGHAASGVEG